MTGHQHLWLKAGQSNVITQDLVPNNVTNCGINKTTIRIAYFMTGRVTYFFVSFYVRLKRVLSFIRE